MKEFRSWPLSWRIIAGFAYWAVVAPILLWIGLPPLQLVTVSAAIVVFALIIVFAEWIVRWREKNDDGAEPPATH